MDQKMATVDVVVRKNFPVSQGETVQEALRNLGKAGRAHVMQQVGIDTKKGGCFLVEAFSTAAVFETYKDDPAPSEERYRFWAVSYKRDSKTGEYEFGAMQEVERKTVFQAVASQPPTLTSTRKSSEEVLEGWEKAEKSLFAGVV